ncbi:MAG: S8 family serine peptidase [Bacteroidales bacterium]|nr:S8 family serine peptidase [Bacteroidales bacterium]
MKKIYLILAVFTISLTALAQTPLQLTRVLKETNRSALLNQANIYRQQSEEQKAIAVESALQNGWPIIIETETSLMELQALDAFGNPLYYIADNAVAAETTSTNELYTGGSLGLNLKGTGMIAGEWDGGAVFTIHDEFNNTGTPRVTQMDAPASIAWHATHVAGTIIGGGVWDIKRGMAYNASLRAYDWDNDEAEMAAEAAGGLLISNHSYGFVAGWYWDSGAGAWAWAGHAPFGNEDYKFGFYSPEAASWDDIANAAPYYLIVKSSGNDRGDGPVGANPPNDGPYDCISLNGVAKNILTIGAVKDLAGGYTGNPADVLMTDFSSWGPADDGRIKPDLCGNGYLVGSAYYDSDDPTVTGYYASSNGTSMSSPNVTGSLLLLQEHYFNLNAAYMKSASLKGLAIHTADECGPDDGPDYMFGWGLLNSETAANVITNRNISSLIKEEIYSGAAYSVTVQATGAVPLRATLVWNDPAGTPPGYSLNPRDIMLVNDLDMTITKGANTYSPYKLDYNNPSNVATTGDNDVDNVEQVHIANPTNDSYTISITHDGSITGGSQEFSLIISGIIIEEPAVTTFEPSSVTANSAYVSGEATAENGSSITERGFVYSTSINPDINDTKVVVGSGLGTFNTTISSLTSNTTYHVRAYATNTTGTGYGDDKDFTTTSTTTWDGSSWDGGAPTASIHAVINGTYTTNAAFDCNNLAINNGKIFNASVNYGVTVNGNFVNNGTFNILSNASGIGSLITLGTVTNSGSFNMQRYVTEDAWHYITSPLIGNTSGVFNGSYLQKWDEPSATWTEIESTSENLAEGIGYSLWSDAKTNTFNYSGSPYTGNKSIAFTKTENGSGYVAANLLGNPFPSAIDWSTLDGIGYGAVYTYDGDNEQYLTWNAGGTGSQYVPPGQGFFIIADYTGTFNLGDANRTHSGINNFVKENKSIQNGFVISASNEAISDELWVLFREDAHEEYEKKYDAYKFFSNRADLGHIYSKGDHTNLSIDARPATNQLQLGFKCAENGNYNIQIKDIGGIASIVLEDTKLEKMHDLKFGSYAFDWNIGDSEERFILHLSATATQEISDSKVQIYTNNKQLYIRNNSSAEFSDIHIYDLAGRTIYQGHLTNEAIQIISLQNQRGAYFVQLVSGKDSQVQKIIIQ